MSFALRWECLGLMEAPGPYFPPRIGRFPAGKFTLKPEQKHPGSVFVPGARCSAGTFVPAFPEGLFCHSAAGMAGLRRFECSCRGFEHPGASLFRFAPEHSMESCPSRIQDGSVQTPFEGTAVSGHALDVEVFDGQGSVYSYDPGRYFMQEVVPAAGRLLMTGRKTAVSLFEAVRYGESFCLSGSLFHGLLLPGDDTLNLPESLEGLFEKPRVRHGLRLVRAFNHSEGLETPVESGHPFPGLALRSAVQGYGGIPLPVFDEDLAGFRRARCPWPATEPDGANSGKTDEAVPHAFSSHKPPAVAGSLVSPALEAVHGLEPWVSGRLYAILEPLEEGPEGQIQPFQRDLFRLGVKAGKELGLLTPLGEDAALFVEPDGSLFLSPDPPAFIQRRIPEQAVHPALVFEGLSLMLVRVKPVRDFALHHVYMIPWVIMAM